MGDTDAKQLLLWLDMDDKMQSLALESLSTNWWMIDNVDVLLQTYKPSDFLPKLCKIVINHTIVAKSPAAELAITCISNFLDTHQYVAGTRGTIAAFCDLGQQDLATMGSKWYPPFFIS